MSVIPLKKNEQVEWCEAHVPVWTAVATNVGLTSAQCTAFGDLTEEARKNYDEAQAAREAAKGATTLQNTAISAAVRGAADLIRVIRGYAEQQADPDVVYALAQIPPQAPRVPATAPGKPDGVIITLNPDGTITLTWAAENSTASTGGFFEIKRKLPGQASFINIGGAPGSTVESRRMFFTDESIPTSAASQGAQYIITGRRGTRVGTPSDAITVQFGVDGTTVSGGTLAIAA